MKKPNPVENVHQLDPIDLSLIEPLPTATQLAQLKQQQAQLPPRQAAAEVAAPVAQPRPSKSDNPQQLVDKADEALSILKGQMEQIKLKYDSLNNRIAKNKDPVADIATEKGRLEAQALTIKVFIRFKVI